MKKQSLSKSERIKKKNDFEKVYRFGHTIFSSDKIIKATYFFDKANERGSIKAAFAVHRRAGKAVWRNRIKRLLRESYRLNKSILFDDLKRDDGLLLIVFSPSTINEGKLAKPKLHDVVDSVTDLMKQIKDELKSDA